MDQTIWSLTLSFVSALGLFLIKATTDEIKRLQVLINRTREEVARDHVTRQEFRADMQQLLDRFDRLETKIDSLRVNRPTAERCDS